VYSVAPLNDKRIILIITCMAAWITPFLGASINIALPAVNSDFGVTDQALIEWVVTGFLLSAAVFVVPFGRIADIFGRKTIFGLGLLVIIVSSLLCSVSNSILMLIAARVIEGLGSAMIFGTSMAILTSVYPPNQRGKVLGINVAIVYLGLSAGPVIGGIITQYLGWRYIYAGITVYTLIVSLLVLLLVKEEWRCAETGKFDILGTILYGAMLFSLIYGLAQVPDISGAYLIGVSILIMIAFFWWELRHKNPVVKVGIFRNNHVFVFSNIAALINYSATFAVAFLLSLYLQYTKGLEPQTAGIILIVAPIVQAVFSPLTGKLSDRIEPRIVASAGMGLCIIGLAVFALLTPETPLYMIVAGLGFMGLGFALFSSPNTNAIMSSVEKCDYGVASGMVSTMRLIGQMMSLGIAMLTFSIIMGHTEIAQDHSQLMSSIHIAFAIFAALCVIGLGFSMIRGNVRKVPVQPIARSADGPKS